MNRKTLGRPSSPCADESCSFEAATWLVLIIAATAAFYPPAAAKADNSLAGGALQVPERLLLCQPIGRLSRERLRVGAISTNARRDGHLDERVGAMWSQCF